METKIEKCLLVNKDYKMMMMHNKGRRGNGRGQLKRSRLSFNKMIMTMMMIMIKMIITK